VQIGIEWLPEFPLERTRLKHTVCYNLAPEDYDQLPEGPGIYVFAREGRSRNEALYVGKAEILKRRIRRQLNNLTLMNHVAESGRGRKFIVCGQFTRTNELHLAKRLDIAERAFIRHFLEEDHDLVNEMARKLVSHTIELSGRRQLFGLRKKMDVA
jgi:hypothetical protein